MLHHAPLPHFLNEAEEDAVASGSFMREAELPQTASFAFHAGCAPSMRSRQRVLFSQTRNHLRVMSNSPSRALSVSQLSPGSSRWPKQRSGRLSGPACHKHAGWSQRADQLQGQGRDEHKPVLFCTP